jgi:hypothetical protein
MWYKPPMASSDFILLTDGIDANTLLRGVTAGVTPPPGGGTNVYAWNMAVEGITGAAGFKYTALDFDPMLNGGRISGALTRLPSAGTTGFAPLIYMSLQGSSVNDTGYLLGLQDGDPSNIVLRKGSVVSSGHRSR